MENIDVQWFAYVIFQVVSKYNWCCMQVINLVDFAGNVAILMMSPSFEGIVYSKEGQKRKYVKM